MNCCARCFIDQEIAGYVESTSTQQGDCDFCKEKGTAIVPCAELYDYFQQLFVTYKVPSVGYAGRPPQRLFQHLKSWNIFADLGDPMTEELTKAIGTELYADDDSLFDIPVIPKVFEDPAYVGFENRFIETWEKLKSEIKHDNRFFLKNQFDFDQFKEILRPFEKIYQKGKRFYRARNCDSKGLELARMGRPPAGAASAGRANPQGISYLYISNDIKTTIYEVRSTLYDYVAVAELQVTEELRIASLRNTEKISPFILEDNINTYLLYREFLSRIEADLVKPLRRHDSDLDYLPTQYLCEFVKSLGYDGIEYSSSLNRTGFNIALFNDDKVKFVEVETYEVTAINYDFQQYVS
jgi:hypothetical protein